MGVSNEIRALFDGRGAETYFGESVSTLEHMLQAAHFAELEAADAPLVVAALLHDVGHLIQNAPDDIAEWHADGHHEVVGGRWLAKRFGSEVSDPVRLHVPAKRYLCATDGGYFAKLSPASVITLKLQGGPMSAEEVVAFEREPFWREAVRLRRWDDAGKVAGLKTRSLESYLLLVEATATARS
jgi:phosphonate degradation associated HDIG domain protein